MLTSWQVAGVLLGMAAYVFAWFRGGRPERLAVGILVYYGLLSSLIFKWDLEGSGLLPMALAGARFLAFGWLCFRLDRWWPFVMTAALALIVLIHVARLLDPSVSQYAMASAAVGLGYLVDLTLISSVFERRLAGEPATAPAAWASAVRATAARRAARARGAATPGRAGR